MSKEKKFLDYNTLIRDNLLNVVRQALNKTADYGLSDGHHFYITFLTKFKGAFPGLNPGKVFVIAISFIFSSICDSTNLPNTLTLNSLKILIYRIFFYFNSV